jgi:hypothetical protein
MTLQLGSQSDHHSEVLKRWASLSRPEIRWNEAAKMIQAAEADSGRLEARLRSLLKTSNDAFSRISLCEPLFADAGLNRWLSAYREEAYSDWLEWILRQLQLNGTATDILSVLGIDDCEIIKGCEFREFEIKREFCIGAGRLDLLLCIKDFLTIVVEIKKYSADTSATAKQKGYYDWLQRQQTRHLRALLLVPDGAEVEYENFSRLLWADVCIRLRRLLPALLQGIGTVKTSMFIAFIGAVETNLLNLAAPESADARTCSG